MTSKQMTLIQCDVPNCHVEELVPVGPVNTQIMTFVEVKADGYEFCGDVCKDCLDKITSTLGYPKQKERTDGQQ